jgi:hypothetical protein
VKDIRPALRSYLFGDPTVNGLVGGARIHHLRLPQDDVGPSIVFTKITEAADYHMAGGSGLVTMRMQFDAWAQNADAATQLANAMFDRLSGAKGVIGTDSVDVQGIYVVNGRDDYDGVTKLYRVSRDYLIWYRVS